jgi:hypothetical protein
MAMLFSRRPELADLTVPGARLFAAVVENV